MRDRDPGDDRRGDVGDLDLVGDEDVLDVGAPPSRVPRAVRVAGLAVLLGAAVTVGAVAIGSADRQDAAAPRSPATPSPSVAPTTAASLQPVPYDDTSAVVAPCPASHCVTVAPSAAQRAAVRDAIAATLGRPTRLTMTSTARRPSGGAVRGLIGRSIVATTPYGRLQLSVAAPHDRRTVIVIGQLPERAGEVLLAEGTAGGHEVSAALSVHGTTRAQERRLSHLLDRLARDPRLVFLDD